MDKLTTHQRDDDSEEIAAALAAAYALCASEEASASVSDSSTTSAAWRNASLLEGTVKQRFVSSKQVEFKTSAWKESFSKKWTAFSVYLLFLVLSQSNSAQALERIQYQPEAKPGSAKKRAASDTSAAPQASTDNSGDALSISPLCPLAPPIVSSQEKLPGDSHVTKATNYTFAVDEKRIPKKQRQIVYAAPTSNPDNKNTQTASLDNPLRSSSSRLSTNKLGANVVGSSAASTNVAGANSGGANSAVKNIGAANVPSANVSAASTAASILTSAAPPLTPSSRTTATDGSASSGDRNRNGGELRNGSNLAQSGIYSSANLVSQIRIAINTNTNTTDIIVPDGAQIIDESNQSLLAELPTQSRWLFSLDNGPGGKRLSVTGKVANSSAGKLLLASSSRNYDDGTYTRKFRATGKGGFTRQPHQIDSSSPIFYLPVKTALIAATTKPSDFRPVAYQASPGALAPLQKAQTTPPVVTGYIIKPSNPNGVITCDGKTYRGAIVVKPRSIDNSFLTINVVDLEDYLLSVVPSEMPSTWNIEALKAQTIAARSYALSNLGKHQSEAYDLKATTEDQVYLGVQTESDNSNRAIAETSGQVLKHKGKVVTAFFHSAGGGYTEQAENVFGGKLPYLKSVPDFDDQSPHFAWNRSIAISNIEETLSKQGRDIGGLLGIFPLERSQSQRVTAVLVAGTLQTIMLSGEELRKVLSLPSTVFNIGAGPETYLVAGRGFGHGLGMSQWGAKYLSEQGYNASQICSYYYKDVTVEQF